MKNSKWLLFGLLFSCNFLSFAQEGVYLFSYFVKNGEDGLHFAKSIDGLHWEKVGNGKSYLSPQIGKDKLMRDPCILQAKDGTFHMVWTSGWWDKIIGYSSSKDLVNWNEQKAIPVMEHEISVKNSWAPEISYDSKRKEFIIFWASTIPGRHSDIADSEKEKGLNHRIYATRTKDFKSFSKTELFFNPDFSVIDATILKKGKLNYMFLKNENPNPPEKNIRISTSKNTSDSYSTQVSKPITGAYWAEGPTAIEIGEYVYVYFDKYRDHKYGAVRSKDMINWEDVSDQISFPDGVRHGTVIKVKKAILEGLEDRK